VLLLVSRYFLASDYCYETEMQRAVQRHEEGTARVIPIILRPCSWEESEFKKLQVLPTDGKPVTSWTNPEEAFLIVEKGIRQVVDALNEERRRRAAVELERQQELTRLRQQQAEAERLAQAQKAAEQRQQAQAEARRLDQERQHQAQLAAEQRQREQEAERLQQQAQQAEAERLRQAQQTAERQEQERLRKAEADRLQQQQAEAARQAREQHKQLAVERQRQREVARQGQTGIGRRRALQIAGLGGVGLIVTIATNGLRTKKPDASKPPAIAEPPTIAGSSPDDLSSVDIQSVNVDATGTITERPSGQVSAFRETLDNNVGLDMVQIPAGEFVMGSPAEETGRDDDEGPQRTVTVPRFFIGRFQVTQAQYEAVMGQNPSRFKGADRPVEQVSWDDAVAFCEKLSGLVGRTYRLPSEAEWEYACRAKTTAPFNVGPTLTTDLANYNGNESYGNGPKGIFREETTDVGSFPPNAFGLHDMHGNVYEWCQDVWHENYEGAPTDGSAWVDGGDQAQRVLRGGSWFIHPVICRSADRLRGPRDGFNVDVGFRVVLVPA
jgi:formylglycine-generating enzyme required for sulfatase activity